MKIFENENKELEKLYLEWNKKLEQSGLIDVELSENMMQQPSFHITKKWNQETEDYYHMASEFLNQHNFTSDRDRKVWELYCDGKSIAEIHRIMNCNAYVTICNLIKRLKKKMIKQDWRKDNDISTESI